MDDIQPKDRMVKPMVRTNRPARTSKTRVVRDEESGQEYLEAVGKHAQFHEDTDKMYLTTKPYPSRVKAKNRAKRKVQKRSRQLNRNV